MRTIKTPALRYHGGKFRLAPWLMQFFPKHQCYVEPYGGAASVLLLKERSYAEVYNDLDGDICNFFEVLRDPVTCAQLEKQLTLTPYARSEFDLAWRETSDPIERARRTAIRAQMGFGSGGATKNVTGFRIDTRREYGTSQQLWTEYPAAIASVGARLQGVLIENRPALEVILRNDDEQTLFFVDPPYVMSSRVVRGKDNKVYRHEMSDVEHRELAETLHSVNGMVVLCGYPSDLYQELYGDWETYSTSARISGGRGTSIRTELVWVNPACSRCLGQMRLPFAETPAGNVSDLREAL